MWRIQSNVLNEVSLVLHTTALSDDGLYVSVPGDISVPNNPPTNQLS